MTTDPAPTAAAASDQPPGEPTVADFAFQDFYRTSVERERMQVSREEVIWVESGTRPDQPVEVLLNFGCNVRQTPHLQREAVAVLEVLGVDFAAVAGQKFCCGKPYSGHGLADVAEQVVRGSIKRAMAGRGGGRGPRPRSSR